MLQKPWESKYGDLGGGDSHQHVDDQRDRGQARQQAKQKHQPPGNLHHPHEWRHHFRGGDANLDEAADAQGSRKQELLNSLRKENASHHQPDENRGWMGAGGTDSIEHSHGASLDEERSLYVAQAPIRAPNVREGLCKGTSGRTRAGDEQRSPAPPGIWAFRLTQTTSPVRRPSSSLAGSGSSHPGGRDRCGPPPPL